MVTYFLSKCAHTHGKITTVDLTPEEVKQGWVMIEWTTYDIGKGIFPTEEEAKADAVKRIQKKVASHMKQIERLEKLLPVFAPSKEG